MSTIVCQNIVSCFDPQLTETTTTLKLKMAPPPPLPPPAAMDFSKKLASEVKTNLESTNWGFLQSTPKESDNYYTHPLSYKSSFSRLSAKSLELCTENLGSETGTDTISDAVFFSSPPPSANPTRNDPMPSKRVQVEAEPNYCKQKINSGYKNCSNREIRNFPPPLTTMSGSSSLQVRRRRDGGRLIIEAVEAPFRNSYLQAERSDGRLRLCFLTNPNATTTTSAVEEEEEEDDDECEEETDELEKEEINLEMEKFQWRSRCKESGHGNKELCSNWKPALWVATS